MKIIIGELIATVVLDVKSFEARLKKDLKLYEAIRDSVKQISDPLKISALQIVYRDVDWGQVLRLFHETRQDIITVYIRKCKIINTTRYEPDTFDGTEFTFKEKKVTTKEYLVTHTFIPLMEHHIERHLGDSLIDYADKTWRKKENM